MLARPSMSHQPAELSRQPPRVMMWYAITNTVDSTAPTSAIAMIATFTCASLEVLG